jgi:hypothetical protein
MLDIINIYNFVLIRGATLSTNTLVLESSAIDRSLQPEDGSPMQSQFSTGVHPHDGAMTELAHDGNMVVF